MRHHATRKIGFALLTIVLALGATATMRAQEKVTGDKLGTVHFPVSCTAAAQAELDRAVALLHSFWWGPATDSFRGVLTHDPTCGMAHWGIAMAALGNPFGWPPPAKALTDGAAALGQARAVGARTARERDLRLDLSQAEQEGAARRLPLPQQPLAAPKRDLPAYGQELVVE